jgi:pyruvate dehydrogenase E2 component (dihydrolipoamide acetyltransferase)
LPKDKGVDLSQNRTGSGEGGRIVKKDIDAAQAASQPTAQPAASRQPASGSKNTASCTSGCRPPHAAGDFEDTPVSQMRKTIARRLSESLFTAPHFYLTDGNHHGQSHGVAR